MWTTGLQATRKGHFVKFKYYKTQHQGSTDRQFKLQKLLWTTNEQARALTLSYFDHQARR